MRRSASKKITWFLSSEKNKNRSKNTLKRKEIDLSYLHAIYLEIRRFGAGKTQILMTHSNKTSLAGEQTSRRQNECNLTRSQDSGTSGMQRMTRERSASSERRRPASTEVHLAVADSMTSFNGSTKVKRGERSDAICYNKIIIFILNSRLIVRYMPRDRDRRRRRDDSYDDESDEVDHRRVRRPQKIAPSKDPSNVKVWTPGFGDGKTDSTATSKRPPRGTEEMEITWEEFMIA